MIKVANILTSVEFGGSEKVNLTFLRNVNRKQFDIHPILLVRPWENDNLFIRQVIEAGYSISRIPVAIKPITNGRDYLRIARCILYLYRILSTNNFHLLHTHGYFADIIGTPVCKYLRIPHLSTCHGFIQNDKNLKIYNKLDKLMLRFCERIIAVSTEIKSDLVRSGIDKARITVIQNAVQESISREDFAKHRVEKRQYYSIEQDEFVIGYVGRLSEEKGINYLIEASSLLKDESKTFKILILGDGPKRKDLEEMARSKGLEKRIIFTGFQENIEEWLPALDVFVLPSLTEGTPMALLEAMSMGIPVIATAVGGIPKVVENNVNGFLVDPGDFQGLYEKIIMLNNNQELRNKMATEGIKTIKEKFNVNKWCHKIEEEYISLSQIKL